jgi:hypothetical protein
MSRRPKASDRVDDLRATATIIHETIFQLHQRLLVRDPGETRSLELVAESARIVTVELPARTALLRQLGATWTEQVLLDPAAAAATSQEIATQMQEAERTVLPLISRQREIVAKLRAMLA